MTDSMNFGPDWIRNLSSDGSTGNAGGGTGGGTRYQLAEYRYGREEMLALFDKNSKPPVNLTNFKCLYSDIGLLPLALLPTSEEERGWQGRVAALSVGPPARGGRGGSMERGGGRGRGRGGGVYQYSRVVPAYEGGGGGGWGNNGDQSDWSPRKEYNPRTMSMDNWRRSRNNNEEDDGWRNVGQARTGIHDKWTRSTSWRGEGDSEERTGPPERGGRTSWSEQMNRGQPARRSWDNEDHLPEWATENPTEGGGSFDDKGAFHGSDDEQLEGRPPNRRETPALQKSTSQQHISSKSHHPPLASSKSTMSLVKSEDSTKRRDGPPKIPDEDNRANEEIHMIVERKKSVPNIPEKIDKEVVFQERAKSEGPPKCKPNEKQPELIVNGPMQDTFRHEDSDFEKLQEDFVLKLVVDEELPKQTTNNFEIGNIPVPPNLVAQQIPDKWFYQDPQGQMQGPFTNLEMAEWYKAGYFSNQLKVRRHYDERFFLLGELISMCGGVNPFQAGVRFPTLKNDVTKMPEPDIAQFQYLSQMNAYKEAQARIHAEPWSALTLQQQETAAQRLIMQQQVPQDLQYIQQPPVANPLMHMINQMQQASKLPGQGLVDKQPPNIPGTIDPHLHMHMSNILSMQSRIPAGSMTNNLPTGMAGNLTGSMPPENLSTSMPSHQSAAMNSSGMTLSGMQGSIPVSIGGSINMPRPTSHGSVDQVNSVQDNDPISSLLKQLQQQKQHDWQQNQYGISTSSAPPPQWQTQNEVPLTMWDLQQNNAGPASPAKIQPEQDDSQSQQHQNGKVEKELRMKEEALAKELKRKKEQEEKQLKKEAEERRKQEQRRMECEKRVAEEKKRKEEERVKKELEKVKREAEEKRMRELEEKRKLKDQRKAEEEAKKRAEEHRKAEEERIRQELKKAEAKRQADDKKLQQEQIRIAKVAPWSQSNSTLGMSLTEIQKAEKERKAQETALQVQRLQEKEMHQQQQQEKNTGIHLNWAKKPVEPRKVKSLAEIQAEEQEQLAKQAAESRLQKEKEVVPVANNTSSIWNSQNLNWTNPSANNHQWSTTSGFWDDSSSKNLINKPSSVTKSNSTNTFNTSSTKQQQLVQAQKHQTKSKTKKEEPPARSNHNNNNRPATDDFTNWCYKTLSNISTNVDIPTFITFLRDIESAFDVREYCKEYLGESNATHQFASNFLEKRRSFKPKNNAHKDDMCSPAPAITPSLQHSTEFQEVKGKKQKNKKSKMLKVDSRILGFNVTSAPDRINVGDRDYGDNS